MREWDSGYKGKQIRHFRTNYENKIFFFFFLGHMKVPRLGVKSMLHLLAYATATSMPNLSHACSLHHSSQQHRILNPVSKARD